MSTFGMFMRVISSNTIKNYWEKYPTSEQSLKSWLQEVENSEWDSPHFLKVKYKSASILSNKRVVFNIKRNKYRLLVDIEFRLKIVFVVWFGTHSEYNLINAKTITYVQANKK
jgi:mRNA interferase HigB